MKSERHLRQTLEKLQFDPSRGKFLLGLILDAPLVVYAKDAELKFIVSNHQHGRLLQKKPDEIIGFRDADLFGEEAAEIERVSRRVLEEGRVECIEFPLTLPDGARTFSETIYPVRNELGVTIGVAGIAVDITARVKLENDARQRSEELERTLQQLQRVQERLVQQSQMVQLTSECVEMLQLCQDPHERKATLQQFAQQLFPLARCEVYLEVLGTNRFSRMDVDDLAFSPGEEIRRDQCWAMRTGHVHAASSQSHTMACYHYDPDTTCWHLCGPVYEESRLVALLTYTFMHDEMDDDLDACVSAFRTFCQYVSSAMSSAAMM